MSWWFKSTRAHHMSRSFNGLGYCPVTAKIGVRFSIGTPFDKNPTMRALKHRKRVRFKSEVSKLVGWEIQQYPCQTSKISAIQNRGAVEDTQSQIYFILWKSEYTRRGNEEQISYLMPGVSVGMYFTSVRLRKQRRKIGN